MKFDPTAYPQSELTEKIIGSAMAVHRALGPGLDESIYENSLWIEFFENAIDFTQQENFSVYYRDRYVGRLITDLIIDVHIAQVLSYLSITGLKVGIILNFKPASLKIKKVANIYLKNQ